MHSGLHIDGGLAERTLGRNPVGGRGLVSGRALVLGLFAFLAAQQLALWTFLGLALWFSLIGAAGFAGLLVLLRGTPGWRLDGRPSLALLGTCLVVATLACLLGGEGRFFYANSDWQVRDAVLRDLVVNPWPFVYQAAPSPLVLRAPLGMYLLPSLIGKINGFHAAELALLGQNSLLLATLLTIGATFFSDTRSRLIALVVFMGFSGMDVLGAAMLGKPLMGHMENWLGTQYSSHITQIFWVPQHGMAGWIGALLYLLWRDGRLPRATFFAALPLLALLSPLALIGLMPFAAHAGLEGMFSRRLAAADVLIPALAVGLATPSLFYLTAAQETVGQRAEHIGFPAYVLFELVEVMPFLVALLVAGRHRFGTSTTLVIAAVLLLAPFGKIGQAGDFVMRASIPALAVLAIQTADLLAGRRFNRHPDQAWLLAAAAFAIGLFTPAAEIIRAVRLPASPALLCSYMGVVPGGAATYDAPLARLPSAIRPVQPLIVRPRDPEHCWDGSWPDVLRPA